MSNRYDFHQAPLASAVCLAAAALLLAASARAGEHPAPLPIDDAAAKTEAEMKPYTELIEHSYAKIDMVPIPGGTFVMGSAETEEGHKKSEGPLHKVAVSPFWMSTCEITWDAYEVWMDDLDVFRLKATSKKPNVRDKLADEYQLTQPTPPYVDMSFGMGKRNFPAISMTQLSARTFCQWLSAKTGRYYRLPTEAEWEYACRAGTTTAYHFGDDPAHLDEYAWYKANAGDKYQKVGQKKPNPWGLYDMHGNVAEWVLDQHTSDFYAAGGDQLVRDPLAIPKTLYPRVVRGGSWADGPKSCRAAARLGSEEDWKQQDPQVPQSIWYHTDATFVGFRIVRPLVEPSEKEKKAKWDNSKPFQDRKKPHLIDPSLRD